MRLQKRTIRQKLAGIQAVNRIGMGKDRIYTENVDNPKNLPFILQILPFALYLPIVTTFIHEEI